MQHSIFVILGFLIVFVLAMLAFTGLKHALRRLLFAVVCFVVVFCGVFFGLGWATGAVPAFPDLPSNIERPEFWVSNWVGVGLGLVMAGFSARILLTRKV